MLIPMAPSLMFGTALHPVTHVDDTSPEDGVRGIRCPVALFNGTPRGRCLSVWIFRHVAQGSAPM